MSDAMKERLRDLQDSLLVGSAQVALGIACFGAISYVVLLVGSRVLTPADLANFVSIWAISNTAILALIIPVDTLAPRLRLEVGRTGMGEGEVLRFVNVYAAALSVLLVFCLVVGSAVQLIDLSTSELISVALFVIAVSFSLALKAEVGSRGRFDLVLYQSVSALFAAFVGLGLIWTLGRSSVALLLFGVTGAYAAGWLVLAVSVNKLRTSNKRPLREFLSEIGTKTGVRQMLPSLIIMTLLMLLLSNGALMIARPIGVPDGQVVAFAAMLNLALVPCTLLNAMTPPIHIRIVRSLGVGRVDEVSETYRTSIRAFVLAACVIAGVSGAIGPWLVTVYVGGNFGIGHVAATGIAAAESMLMVASLPRIFLTAMAETEKMRRYSLVSCLVFFGVLLLPTNPFVRMILAPLCAAGVGLLLMHKEVRRAFSRL